MLLQLESCQWKNVFIKKFTLLTQWIADAIMRNACYATLRVENWIIKMTLMLLEAINDVGSCTDNPMILLQISL